MHRIRLPARRTRLALLAGVLSAGALAFTANDVPGDRWVQRARLDMLSGKGLSYPVVARLRQGDKLRVVERDPRGWLMAEYEDKKGFVHEKALATREIKVDDDAIKSFLTGQSDAPQISAAAAAKGLEPQTIAYSIEKGYSTQPLEQMRRLRESIDPAEAARFMATLVALAE